MNELLTMHPGSFEAVHVGRGRPFISTALCLGIVTAAAARVVALLVAGGSG
jgi:hypothetical protein